MHTNKKTKAAIAAIVFFSSLWGGFFFAENIVRWALIPYIVSIGATMVFCIGYLLDFYMSPDD